MIIHKIVPILGLVIGMPILSQEVPKANFSVCDKIKHLDPQASAEVYAAFAEKMKKSGVNSCACGTYLWKKKFEKAHKQMTSEYQLSANDLKNIEAAEFAYEHRPSASRVIISIDPRLDNEEIRQHIVETVQEFQEIREQQYLPLNANVATEETETLHISIIEPKSTINENNSLNSQEPCSSTAIDINSHKKSLLDEIRLRHGDSVEDLRGTFNHEFTHYYFGHAAVNAFLSIGFNRAVGTLVQPRNSIQKYFFAQEYCADWFVGLMTQKHRPFEDTKQALQKDKYLSTSNNAPSANKRINWLSRWINLKRAENKA